MISQFFRDSALYMLAGFLTRGISFILLPFYTRAFSPADYGILDYLTVLGGFLSVTVALEISQGLARYMPEHRDDAGMRRAYASTSLWFTLFSYTSILMVAVLFQNPLAILLLDSPDYSDMLVVAAISYWISGLVRLVQNQLRWELRAKDSSLVSIMTAGFTVMMAALLVLWFHLGVMGALIAQVIGGAISSLFGLYLARNSYGLCFDFRKLSQMLSFSLPLVPSSMGVVLALYIDRIAIRELMFFDDVGLYGVGYRLAMIVSLIMLGVQSGLTPLIYTFYKEPSTPFQLAKIFRIFVAVGLLFFLGLSLFSDIVISLLAPPEYTDASSVVPFLVLATLFGGMYIFAPGLNIAKKTSIVSIINILAAILNAILNFSLIPSLGIVGAAFATLISTLVCFCSYMVFSQRIYPVPHSWPSILGGLVVAVTLVYVGEELLLKGYFKFVFNWGALAVMLWMILKLQLIRVDEIRSATYSLVSPT